MFLNQTWQNLTEEVSRFLEILQNTSTNKSSFSPGIFYPCLVVLFESVLSHHIVTLNGALKLTYKLAIVHPV